MEEENTNTLLHGPPQDYSDLDFSFNSTTSTSSFATTFASSASASARSSLSLSLPSFSTSTSLINPHPHTSSNNSPHWSAIRAAANLSKDGNLHFRHLHLLRHLGSGHLAKVFHCRLKGSDALDFALKVVDLDAAGGSAKLSHVRTEARVLAALDHPFLPTLYARLDATHYACFLIDYCPGGDLHSLLLRHPGHRLPLPVARFLAAEVLLALEYLHALGFVYRDLKPENVLIRSDGHVMLSDFDLCFSADVSPSLQRHRRRRLRSSRRRTGGCFRHDEEAEEEEELEFVAEPEAAFSRACVGTHEYLAPEVVSGNGHGNAVDWWAFGIFIYELIYGRTPFKGSSKESTLKNIMKKNKNNMNETSILFPTRASSNLNDDHMSAAKDLIKSLLVHDPKERLGSQRGASEIKKHPFFQGLRWPLIRAARSPLAVGPAGAVVVAKGAATAGWRSSRKKWTLTNSFKALVRYSKGIKLLGVVGNNKKKLTKVKKGR